MKTFLSVSAGVIVGLAIADLITEGTVHCKIFGAVNACVHNVPGNVSE